MSLTLELPTDLEKDLNDKAAENGLPIAQFAVAALRRGIAVNGELELPKTLPDGRPLPRIFELRGLGAGLWKEDAQEWVNREREDWDK